MNGEIDMPDEENNSNYIPLVSMQASVEVLQSPSYEDVQSNNIKIFCHICQHSVPVDDHTFELTVCGHSFCMSCMKLYVEHRVRQGQIHLKCFYQDKSNVTHSCGMPIAEDDIQKLISSQLWKKYLEFKFQKANATSRQCPKCNHYQAFPNASTDHPVCECEVCFYRYCFSHSDAHTVVEDTNSACIHYEGKLLRCDPWSTALIRETCRACPTCGLYVEKDGGCNQMRCLSCHTTFCWICLQPIDEDAFPIHYQWWNVGGCPGNQMVQVGSLTKWEQLLSKMLRGFFVVIIGPPALAITLVATVLCCCCVPVVHMFDTTSRKAFTTCLCISGYIIISPILALISIITCSWFCVRDCREPDEIVRTDSVSTLPHYTSVALDRAARIA